MGSTPKNPCSNMRLRLVLVSLSLVHCLPIEDTEAVAAAKAEFAELFAAAEAGEHAALAPVNNDVQASQMPAEYLEDTKDVAAAKAAFNEAFEEAKSGDLAAKQAPAPVHVVADPVSPTYTSLPLSYHSVSYTPYSYPTHPVTSPLLHHAAASYYHPTTASLPHYSIPAFSLHGLPYSGLPYSGLPAYNGAFHPYAGFPTIAYNTLASVPAEVEEEE